VPIVLKSGSLNLLEPSGPVQACNGIALTFMADIIENTKRSLKTDPACYSCQCIWQVLPVVKQMQIIMEDADFNFLILFLNT
jgi:hypothetical protein